MSMGIRHSNRDNASTGVGLIELMIALSLGMTMILAVTEVATNNSRTRAELERNTYQLESAAYALRMLEGDISNAGFWGEGGKPGDAAGMSGGLPTLCPGLGPDITAAGEQLRRAMFYPVQGGTAASPGRCVSPKPDTHYIAIRRAGSCRYAQASCRTSTDRFYLQVNACFMPGEEALPVPGDIAIDADIGNLQYTSRDCNSAVLAPRYRYVSRAFYINRKDELVRSELGTVPARDYYAATLVEGVETMRVEYGIDTDGDGHVDLHTNSPATSQWSDVTMLRVSLVVRNLSPSFGFVDDKTYSIAGSPYAVPEAYKNHKRQVYSRTLSVRNIAGRREAQ